MMCRASLGEFGPSPNQKPPGEAKGACGNRFTSATAANMEVSKISAGVKEMRLSFTTLTFFTTCLAFFFRLTVIWAVVGNFTDQFHSGS